MKRQTQVRKLIATALLGIFRKNKLRKIEELNRTQWLSLPKIKDIQERRFVELMEHCKRNVPYYKNVDGLSEVRRLKDITQLPFLTKKLIRENLKSLKAINFPEKYFIPNFTSGSTGEALNFFSYTKNEIYFGILIRNNMWTEWDIGEKQAMLWGSHSDISKAQKVFSKIKNNLFRKVLHLSSYEMTGSNMLKYRKKINSYKPQLITGYPSGLQTFSNFLRENNLSIYRPKGIICSGETLYAYQRKEIESVFGCPVYNRYGCREVGNIAHECEKQDGLHINAEHIVVETVDEDGNICKPGELGEIVVTDLDNHAFPFIRYKTGDIGILSDRECRCGRGLPLMEKVEGRVWDIIVGTNNNRLVGTFWLVRGVSGIEKFQVIQENYGEILLKLIVNERFDETEKQKLIDRVYENCGQEMEIKIELVDEIPLTKSGKHRFVISKVSPFVTQLK